MKAHFIGRAQDIDRALSYAKGKGLTVYGTIPNHWVEGTEREIQEIAEMYNLEAAVPKFIQSRYHVTTIIPLGKNTKISTMVDRMKQMSNPSWRGLIRKEGQGEYHINCPSILHKETLLANLVYFGLKYKEL